MAKYRKKPVETELIEAVQFKDNNVNDYLLTGTKDDLIKQHK